MGKQLNDVALWEEYIAKDRPVALRNKLAEKNLKLIYEVINKTKFSTPELCKEDVDDLFQQGFFGLNSAIERFEMGEGRYFYAFAFPFIYGRLMSWIRDKSRMIRIPVVKHDLIMRSFKVKERLMAKGVNAPTMKEIFDLVPEDDQKIGFECWREIIGEWHRTRTYSIDGKASPDGGESTMLDFVPCRGYEEDNVPSVQTKETWRIYPELLPIYVELSKLECFKEEERRDGRVTHFSIG